jgi:hypothetical protein
MQKNPRRHQRRQKVSHPGHGQRGRQDLHGLRQCVRHKGSLQVSGVRFQFFREIVIIGE